MKFDEKMFFEHFWDRALVVQDGFLKKVPHILLTAQIASKPHKNHVKPSKTSQNLVKCP